MITIVHGTCPEIIKLFSIIQECKQQISNYFILHTGLDYSDIVGRTSFEERGLSEAPYNPAANFDTPAKHTRKILAYIEKTLMRYNPDVVLVQGDTNTIPAGALTAAKLHIRVGHVGGWIAESRRKDSRRDQSNDVRPHPHLSD